MPFSTDPDIEKYATKYEIEYVGAVSVIRMELSDKEKQVLCGKVQSVLRNLSEKDNTKELITLLDGDGVIQETVAEEIVNYFEEKIE
jgi:hypothetical protein